MSSKENNDIDDIDDIDDEKNNKKDVVKTFFEKWGIYIVLITIFVVSILGYLAYEYYISWANRQIIEKILNDPRPKTWGQVIKKIKNIGTVSSTDKTFYSNFIKYQRKWGILVNKKKNLCVNKDKWRNALIKTEHLPEGTNQPSWLYLQESDVDDFISVLGKCIKTSIKSKHP